MPKLAYLWSNEEINQLQPQIICERWRSVMETGSGKRKLQAQFTPDEINRIKQLYKKFFVMYYKKFGGSGVPDWHNMSIEDYRLTQRAVHFFATFDQ